MTFPVIAAVRDEKDFVTAVNSNVEIIFHLSPDVNTLFDTIKKAHAKNKKIFIHIDLTEGIGKDKSGIKLAKRLGVDGIISTRANLIKAAREENLFTVQRFFAVDSKSVLTTIETIKSSKPDMIEIMPGIATKVIERLNKLVSMPIIAGGLIDTMSEIEIAIKSGAHKVSTAKEEFWK